MGVGALTILKRRCIVIKYALDVRHGEAIDELAT